MKRSRRAILHPGMKVTFHPKVFKHPYTPYYDAYQGHTFEVVALHPGDHVELKCVSGTVVVGGCVHDDELVRA